MSKRFLSGINVTGTATLNTVADAGSNTDKFLVLDASNNVSYRTAAELYIDLGIGSTAAAYTSTLKHEVKASQTISKGQAVYVSSADGTNMIVSKASNVSEGTSSKTMGLLETSLTTNGKGNVITEGLLSGLNTNGAVAGDPVWLGVDGALIFGLTNKPYAPAHLVFIGIVTRANANNGEIFVKVQNGFEMRELHDYQEGSVQNNQVIVYESSTSLYKPKTIPTILGYTPVPDSRTLTINGQTFDLTTNRTWTVSANLNARTEYEFTTNGSSATYNAVYSVGQVDVFYNGSKLSSTEFTATDGTSVTLGFTPPSGQLVEVVAWETGGGVANGRTLTINGIAYDLSTNRSWTIDNSSLGAQPQLNGTGLVRMSGTSVSYDNTTYATQTFVNTAISNLVASAPSTLDTLNELATALGNDANFATTVTTSIATKLPLAGGTLTGALNGTSAFFTSNLRTDTGLGLKYGSFVSTSGYLNLFSAIVGSTMTLNIKDGTGGYEIALNFTVSANRSYTFPSANGTIALTSDIPTNNNVLTNGAGYITSSGVLGVVLTPYAVGANTAVTTTDTIETAIEKLQGQVNARVPNARTLTINGTTFDLSADRTFTIAAGLTSFNTRTGAVTLTSGDVTTALGFTPVTNARTLTINGTAFDLSADRTWTISGSDATKLPLTGGTITGILSMATTGTNYIRMGVFPNSTSNSGEAWIGRASDRNSGTMTVQLGGGSASSRSFEVVDYAWSAVLFSVGSNGNVTASGSICMTNTNYIFGINNWAGTGGYPGYQFTGGNSRFGFSSTSGYIDVYTDGNFYAGIDLNGNNNLVLHAGNYTSYSSFSSLSASNYFESITGRAATNHGYASIFRNTQSAATNFIPYSFENEYGNHSWGIVARYRINVAAQDRPSIQFSAAGGDDRWNVGYCTSSDWNFRITQNMAYRNDNSTTDNWGTERFRINTDGATFCFSSFTASGNIVAYSDARIKTNVKPIEKSLNKVLNLTGVTYNRTDLEDKTTQIGFIAQEVNKVLPEVVTYNEEFDKYGVSYGNITAILVEAIKEQQIQIEELKTIINGYTK